MDPKVKDYLMKKYYPSYSSAAADTSGIAEAQNRANIGNAAAGIGTALAAGMSRDGGVSYLAGFGESRGGSRAIDQAKVDFSPLVKAGQEAVSKAETDQKRAMSEGMEEDNLARSASKLKREDDFSDPASKQSESARLGVQSVLLSKAKEAEAAGDKESAANIRKQAADLSGLSAADGLNLMNTLKEVDYKDVLNNIAADKRLTKQINSENARASRDATKSEKDMTFKLSKDYQNDDVTTRTRELGQARKSAEALAANPSPANDIALVFAYMRSNDPRSTVREGEYQMAAQSGSLPQKWASVFEQAKSGQLTDKARRELLTTIQTNAKAQEDMQVGRDADYMEQASFYGVRPEIVLGKKASAAANGGGQKIMNGADLPD